ncbi:uncharacterized protein BCR38DRAFT_417804 [Pseudomassariella vexata]|uniref:NTF2 domain-containing protein n=1 Tax=Pseudomassariella vexata TaxID=1141098 RepID=A0A1Y2EJI2_9PEZI|nr:uncharacterized protein BCR38DRAFT_417804 [Pseudomassariella vexata]ORY71711.1 hypothetical protein BCR38DRAFT_417804 [Pseudomassariella vexata]
MSLPSPETQAKVASDAASNFVDHYYEKLNRRHKLAEFYVSASPKLTAAAITPDISINGHHVGSVAEAEALWAKQGQPTSYSVESFDAHPVNPHYVIGAPDASLSDRGDKLSIAIQVAGVVKYGKGEDGREQAFNEAFMLVPHWEAQGPKAPRGMRKWLVVSQNFRLL